MVEKLIYNGFIVNLRNIGDMMSSPLWYFDFNFIPFRTVNILNESLMDFPILILGGGGLFYENLISPYLKGSGLKIGWAIGHNSHTDIQRKITFPQYVDSFSLLGVRDWTPGIQGLMWVPCVSCMHVGFDKEYNTTNDVVVYEHYQNPIPIDCFPKINNSNNSMSYVLEFLGSGAIIVTNSYHGAYWGMLLKKKVIIVSPFSTRFFHFKHPLKIININNLRVALKEDIPVYDVLNEYRNVNYRFYSEVLSMIDKYT